MTTGARIKGSKVVAACAFCGRDVDVGSPHVWQRVVGWQRMAGQRASGSQGGSDIVMRESRREWAHDECVQLERRGLGHMQETLECPW